MLTEEMLEQAAGSTIFDRGWSLVGSVRGLRLQKSSATGSVQGSRVYAVRLDWDEGSVDGSCTCPFAADGSFCKHLVALGLSALDSAPDTDETLPSADDRVDTYLRTLTVDQLRDLVLHLASLSESGQRDLEIRASSAAGGDSDVTRKVTQTVTSALQFRGFIDYRRSFEVARTAEDLLDELEGLLATGAADTVRPALLKAVTRLRTIMLNADDSSGSIGSACQRALDLYARSCREGHPDAVKVAKWLVKFRVSSPGWPEATLDDFVDSFDDKALRAYRSAIAAAIAGHDDDDGSFELGRMRLELADHDGDVDLAIELLSEGDHPRYGEIVTRLRDLGQGDRMMTFVERAVADDRVTTGSGNDYWLGADSVIDAYRSRGRADDAVEFTRDTFNRRPSPAAFDLLCRTAAEAGRVDVERRTAFQVLEARAERSSNADEIVDIAVHDGDLAAAWAAVDRYGPGYRWTTLAAASHETFPDRALELYRASLPGMLGHADRNSYHQVTETLVTMRALAQKLGTLDEVDAEICGIREQYRRRPSMMQIMDSAGLPK